ncbi:MAG: GntR family transcriptional regulator [Pseudomonadota bacterium]
MTTEFVLSQTDGRPMYLQIMEQIKRRITIGDWSPGFRLPSIREMAVGAKVSVITVKRAYQELETEGVIVTQQGKGSFVAEIGEIQQQLKTSELNAALDSAIEAADALGLSGDELVRRLNARLKGDDV